MPNQNSAVRTRVPRLLPLAACLAAILGVSVSHAASGVEPAHARNAHPMSGGGRGPKPTPQSHTVNTCVDDLSQNSLRTLVATAGEGEIIDLAHLPMGCSKITLDSTHVPPYIKVSQNKLYFEGPGKDLLTIDGNFQSSVLRHIGNDSLHVTGLTIANGKHVSDTDPKGGCISSIKHVILTDSTVTGCTLEATGTSTARGGGVYAGGYLTMKGSSVTNNTISSLASATAGGGGVAAQHIDLDRSTVASNTITANGAAYGGGAWLLGSYAHILSSTIANNAAYFGGGLYAFAFGYADVKIENSTISGNRAIRLAGVVGPYGMHIDNTTIAFNMEAQPTGAGGVYAGGTLTLNSSIIADNRGVNGRSDLGGSDFASFSGDHNLVTSVRFGLSPPMNTISSCPHLLPLTDNGGPTFTHDLMHDSPAIDVGSNPHSLMLDQTQGPRTLGANIDIGSIEWNGSVDDRIAIDGFDGLCDQ